VAATHQPEVLFVCVHNAGRSQMAAGLVKLRSNGRIHVRSAGSAPAGEITMGCGDACPIYPGKRYEDWELDDPAGQDVESVRVIRDEIDARVRRLIADLLPAA